MLRQSKHACMLRVPSQQIRKDVYTVYKNTSYYQYYTVVLYHACYEYIPIDVQGCVHSVQEHDILLVLYHSSLRVFNLKVVAHHDVLQVRSSLQYQAVSAKPF